MPGPHGHLRQRVAPHRREVLVKHSLRRAPLEPVPPDAVREPELLVRARVPQRRGLAEQTQRLRVVLLDALAGLVRAAEARHRLAVARLERQDLAQGAHGVRLAPRETRGRAFQRVPRGAELRLRGGGGRVLLRRREPRVGIARPTRRGRIVVVQEQTLLAELALRRLQRARRVARAGRREQQQERRREREAHRMPRPPHAPVATGLFARTRSNKSTRLCSNSGQKYNQTGDRPLGRRIRPRLFVDWSTRYARSFSTPKREHERPDPCRTNRTNITSVLCYSLP